MAEKMLEQLKTVSEIASMGWTPGITEKTFTVIGRLDRIDHEPGWYYVTCSNCSKILKDLNGSFWWDICDGLVRYPSVRFRVHVRVQDDTGEATFAMFNQIMEKLIDCSGNKLLKRKANPLDSCMYGFPLDICRLSGKTFAFEIKMGDHFNPDTDFHNVRIVKLSEIHCTLPKLKRRKRQPAAPLVHTEELPTSNGEPCRSEESTCTGDPLGEDQ